MSKNNIAIIHKNKKNLSTLRSKIWFEIAPTPAAELPTDIRTMIPGEYKVNIPGIYKFSHK